jgi:hypothetical protein
MMIYLCGMLVLFLMGICLAVLAANLGGTRGTGEVILLTLSALVVGCLPFLMLLTYLLT